MLACKAIPRASISKAQNTKTGQNPCRAKKRAKLKENRHVAAKKSLAPEGLSEQLGAKSMRCSMPRRITQGQAPLASASALFFLRLVAPRAQFPLDFFQGNTRRLCKTAPRGLSRS